MKICAADWKVTQPQYFQGAAKQFCIWNLPKKYQGYQNVRDLNQYAVVIPVSVRDIHYNHNVAQWLLADFTELPATAAILRTINKNICASMMVISISASVPYLASTRSDGFQRQYKQQAQKKDPRLSESGRSVCCSRLCRSLALSTAQCEWILHCEFCSIHTWCSESDRISPPMLYKLWYSKQAEENIYSRASA